MYDAEPGEAGQLRFLLEQIDERRAELELRRRDIEETLAELEQVEKRCREDLERLEQGIADRVREEPKHVCAYESPPLLYPRKRSGADH